MSFSVLVPAQATVQVVAVRRTGGVLPGGFLEFEAAFGQPVAEVPEPDSAALLAVGFVVLAGGARRRVAPPCT